MKAAALTPACAASTACCGLFQSPCGEVVMKEACCLQRCRLHPGKFQSPCGEVVMKDVFAAEQFVNLEQSFSPLAGKW
jgi:hypothetical protein